MIEVSASEVRVLIAAASPRREFHVREADAEHKVWRTITKHEALTLTDGQIGSGRKARAYVSGMVNKNGVRWLRLLVPGRVANKLMNRKLAAPVNASVPEDRRTIERRHVEGGGIVYSHRHDISLIWRRQRTDFRGSGSKSVLVVPRQTAHA
jgi:hypothetical protein